ncbi:HybG family [NiFe] hydrogenase metallocenter assembly protein [Hafnia paralvei ATCC 29927]|jgi:hydrogenase expression/formation protein HypC|uniref:Hydrogenase assembly protein HupF n=2 Tax=Hafnia TaxID=568 RepID=A0A2A2MAU8_9GAMM|nr:MULTISPECIES: hydrogenase maturation factor HybG [Hafnia]AJR02180.1 [NiFe] hydrogenase metallocenter assembly protein HybG [Enterobacteriaceae bacterium bta3-1]EFV39573.1 hydrogenase-2 operon protein hybG [Enterobacteriaceae bacterium 9_2_54FAA]MDU1193329.1 hydrogenase maturation factor HybG [Enterobacteriaceae bacterium]AMH16735.1 HypC/HybG/HupF family hydrogenase formation chaperone [Hafnia paralvei]EHM41607.1 hydrogenase assembly chaperone HypC/HupF [Hafnia alvei ATCC 51873]
MCLGIPGQVVAVGDDIHQMATVDVCGVKREVNIALVCEGSPQDMLGQWVLVHVGFAMSILDEAEAKDTLDALMAMQEVEEDVGYFLRNGEPAPQVSEK